MTNVKVTGHYGRVFTINHNREKREEEKREERREDRREEKR